MATLAVMNGPASSSECQQIGRSLKRVLADFDHVLYRPAPHDFWRYQPLRPIRATLAEPARLRNPAPAPASRV